MWGELERAVGSWEDRHGLDEHSLGKHFASLAHSRLHQVGFCQFRTELSVRDLM